MFIAKSKTLSCENIPSMYVYVNSQDIYHEQRKRNLDFSVEEVNGVKVWLAVKVFVTLADFL